MNMPPKSLENKGVAGMACHYEITFSEKHRGATLSGLYHLYMGLKLHDSRGAAGQGSKGAFHKIEILATCSQNKATSKSLTVFPSCVSNLYRPGNDRHSLGSYRP